MTRSSLCTDECERPVLDGPGDDLDELLEHLDLWSEAIIDAGSYPLRIKGSTTPAAGRTSARG